MIADNLQMALASQFVGGLYPVVRPQEQEAYPCGVYQHVSNTPEQAICAGVGYTYFRIQLSIMARTYSECVALRKSCIAIVEVMPAFVERTVDIDYFDDDKKLFVWQIDFTFRTAEE